MRRLTKICKTLSKTLLITSVAGLSFGCASGLPRLEPIELLIHNQPKAIAQCSRTDGVKCPAKPIKDTHKYYMLSPESFQKLNDYIDSLIRELTPKQVHMNSVQMKAVDTTVPLALSDLRKARAILGATQTRLRDSVR